MTGTRLYTEGGRPVLRIERALRHPVPKVWRALTEPSQLNQWFPFEVETALVIGAEVRFVDKHGGPAGTGTITELDPPRLLGYSWEGDHLRWELSPAAGGSLLVLTHTIADRFGAASFASGWHACLDGLEAVLVGRPVGPPGDMDAAHEHWLNELGLADPEVTDGPDGWRIRFERQLVRPADLAWRVLVAAGPTQSTGGSGSGEGSPVPVVGPESVPVPVVGPEPVVGGSVPAGALIGLPDADASADLTADPTAARIADLTADPTADPTADLTGDPTADPTAARIAELAAGRITELVPAKVLAYPWLAGGAPAGQVRWELGQGTGHGARVVLTLTGPPDQSATRVIAQTGAQQRIATLAAALRNTPRP